MITWLALTPSPPPSAGLGWDKANHYIAFFVLGTLSYLSQSRSEWQGWLALAGYGIGIEILQWSGGFRHFELWDMFANVTGLICCILCQPILLRLPQVQAIKSLRGTS
ncbi:MAG: VanZ family protein [Pseudomonadales bacterium]